MEKPGSLFLIAGIIFAASSLQSLWAIDMNIINSAPVKQESNAVRKLEIDIDEDRDKIIEENKAIDIDKRKLKESEKISDRKESEKIKEEISGDIKKRESAIKDLKDDVRRKKDERYNLMHGIGMKTPKRNRK